jgi:CRP-like cAMP-binding protein
VTATQDVWVLRIRRQAFRRLLEREPAIAVHLLENVGRRLWEAEQEMATR